MNPCKLLICLCLVLTMPLAHAGPRIERWQTTVGARVLFVDASVSCVPPYVFDRLQPVRDFGYTTHAMKPEALLAVFRQVTGREPPLTRYTAAILARSASWRHAADALHVWAAQRGDSLHRTTPWGENE